MTETGIQRTNAVTTNTLNSETTPVVTVVSAVADASEVDPFELPPLSNVIDAEALNDLVASERHSGLESVSFEYAGYDVVVTGNDDVKVAPTA